ncbi:MAG: NH(3)-dependent NAD(+) synthetase [Candidatus Pacebacteria bacterium GW2011_GWA1_46_10]|nr:MAG: NH(3)-dependent NAD(+) synthetase [Candidatus Pacebacteria bacterium GW2011_GWA1_46_10]
MSDQLVRFLQQTYQQAGKTRGVIAVSGGIDSAVSLTLLTQALGAGDVYPVFLPYHEQDTTDAKEIAAWNEIPKQNWREINIGSTVDQFQATLLIDAADKIRLGNVMARVRMIAVFDLAKKMAALVCGTENKSEHYLGYFTRYGDGASDVEPLVGLYKTQVRELARKLKIPEKFITQVPSAGLWTGQTDEKELGFTYEDADKVMTQLIDQSKKPDEVTGVDKKIVKQVIDQINRTRFKHVVPYTLE